MYLIIYIFILFIINYLYILFIYLFLYNPTSMPNEFANYFVI